MCGNICSFARYPLLRRSAARCGPVDLLSAHFEPSGTSPEAGSGSLKEDRCDVNGRSSSALSSGGRQRSSF